MRNIALLGLDTRQDNNVGRSDAIVILTIDKEHNKLKLTSIARDTYVAIEGHSKDKLTHAYAYGKSQLAVKTLNQNFDLEIKDYVTMNFYGLARVIDYIGGVDINVTEAEKNELNKNIFPEMRSLGMECPAIKAAGAQRLFAQWDTVTVSGTAAQQAGMWEELNGDLVVYDLLENGLRVKVTPKGECFYGTLVQGADSARWTGLDGKETRSFAVSTPVRMERRVPDLDYITECDNRVWGCSSKENVIYACKLGDPTNWFSYRGIAADSYAVTVGSDGAFTGAATCMGYALFFKENTLHKLYGSKPSDFQLTSLRCRGVAKNAARSLCVLNETLYYLSPDGVMAWDGSIPTKVSGVLDSGRLSNVQSAVGGALDGRYYLHIARAAAGEGVARLLVYDTERALWSEEDVCSYEMTSTGGQLYLWDGQALWAADPSRETDWQSTDGVEEKLNFELVTGDIGLDGAEDRYLSRLTLRLDAECGSTVTVAASYDGGPWETVAELAAQNVRRSYDMPFVPRRHGTLRLRLKGRGQITLRSIAKTVAAAKGGITGGEV